MPTLAFLQINGRILLSWLSTPGYKAFYNRSLHDDTGE